MTDVGVNIFTEHPDAPDIESSTLDYADRFSGSIGEWFLEVQWEQTRNIIECAFGQSTKAAVLDVGGGHCQNLRLNTYSGHHLTLLGSSAESREVYDSLRLEERGSAIFEQGSMFDMPYEDNAFDVVICYRILSHINRWPCLCTELCRVARDLVIVDYTSKRSSSSIGTVMFALKQSVERNARRYRLYSDREVSNEFFRHQFNRYRRYPQFFFPMALHRRLGRLTWSVTGERFADKLGLSTLFGSPIIEAFRPIRSA